MSDNQLNALTKQIGGLQADTARQFADLNELVLKLYGHMEERFAQLDAKVDAKADRAQVERLQNTMDGIAKRLETDDHERAAMNGQLDRHEGWITQLADSTSTKLVPEP